MPNRPYWSVYPFSVALGLLIAAGALAAAGVRFSLTPSLPIGLYLETEALLTPGTLVTLCPPREAAALARHRGYLRDGACPGGVQPLGKRILAVASDTVEIGHNGVRVNGRAIAGSAIHERDSQGFPLPTMPFGRHVIGRDSLFVFSAHHPRSFDSRYFGPVPVGSVRSTMRPFWTGDQPSSGAISPARRSTPTRVLGSR